jgi:hypothetical protein
MPSKTRPRKGSLISRAEMARRGRVTLSAVTQLCHEAGALYPACVGNRSTSRTRPPSPDSPVVPSKRRSTSQPSKPKKPCRRPQQRVIRLGSPFALTIGEAAPSRSVDLEKLEEPLRT